MLSFIIEKVRGKLPQSLRRLLMNMVQLTYFIAPLYGYLMIPKFDGSALLFGEGKKFFVHPDISAVHCLKNIYRDKGYEKFYQPKPGDIIFDVGAHVGMSTIKVGSQLKSNCLIIAIEPSSQNIQLLKKIISLHNLSSQVIILEKAVSSFIGKSKFIITPISGQHGKFRIKSKIKVIEVETTRLDDVVAEMKINRIDLLKINIAGGEFKVLKDAEKLSGNYKNIAMGFYYYGEETRKLKEFLKEKNFNIVIIGTRLYAYKVL